MDTNKNSDKVWIIYSVIAMLFFSFGNVFNSMVAAKMGPFTFFYWCSGSFVICILQHLYHSVKQYRQTAEMGRPRCWIDLNFIKGGQLRWLNVLGFVSMTLNLLLNLNLVNMCMWTATLAKINVGVIAVIWSMTPLLQAMFDLCLFR